MRTQQKEIENHLLVHGNITTMDAFRRYHITRLSHYILTLRKKGWKIASVWKRKNGKRWVDYILNKYPTQ